MNSCYKQAQAISVIQMSSVVPMSTLKRKKKENALHDLKAKNV